jgi:hypothetical protein
VSDAFQFQTRIDPSWLAAARVASPRLRIETPFPLMNLIARHKGVTAAIEGSILVLTVSPGDPPAHWPPRQPDMLALLQKCEDAASMLAAIRAAQPPIDSPPQKRPSLSPGKKPRLSRPPKTPAVVSVPMGNMLSTARPDEVWAVIRERKGESFTVVELQEALGASVGPYVMIWARDGYLVKADRDASPGAPWRYRLNRDQPTHPPIG